MNTQFWLVQAFNGVSYGALLFLVGSGLSLIFGVMRIVNLSHGSYFLLGGYVALSVIHATGIVGTVAAGRRARCRRARPCDGASVPALAGPRNVRNAVIAFGLGVLARAGRRAGQFIGTGLGSPFIRCRGDRRLCVLFHC